MPYDTTVGMTILLQYLPQRSIRSAKPLLTEYEIAKSYFH